MVKGRMGLILKGLSVSPQNRPDPSDLHLAWPQEYNNAQ